MSIGFVFNGKVVSVIGEAVNVEFPSLLEVINTISGYKSGSRHKFPPIIIASSDPRSKVTLCETVNVIFRPYGRKLSLKFRYFPSVRTEI